MFDRKEYMKKYRKENKEKIYEQVKKYRAEHPNLIKEIDKRWRQNNPDIKKERDKKYREKNKEYLHEQSKKRQQSNGYASCKVSSFLKRHGIERPSICPICGKEGYIFAHHPDYSYWNKIVRCCGPCHASIHHWGLECPEPVDVLKFNLPKGKLLKSHWGIVEK